MFALAAAVMFLIAAVKDGHAGTALFWLYLGLMLGSLHFAFEVNLSGRLVRRPPQ